MGGRKAAKTSNIVGKNPTNAKHKKDLLKAVKSEKPKHIASSTVKFLKSSKSAIDNLSKALDAFDYVQKESTKPSKDYSDRRDASSKFWSDIKKEKSYKTTSDIDRILVDSLAKSIRRGKK